jgi:hypothetical protein
VFRAAEFRKPPLEIGDLWPQDELSLLQDGRDSPLDAVANSLPLSGQIDEGWNQPFAVCIHAIPTKALGNPRRPDWLLPAKHGRR